MQPATRDTPQADDEDFVIAAVDRHELRGRDGWIDITGADDVEIMIKDDGRVLWVNAPGLRVRICGIRGQVLITDNRDKPAGSTPPPRSSS